MSGLTPCHLSLFTYQQFPQREIPTFNSNSQLNKKVNLTYKNKLDSTSIDREVINRHLMDSFKYKMNLESRLIHSWKLIIEDSLKLKLHKTDSHLNGNNFITFTADSAVIHGVQLAGITYAIQKSKAKRVFMGKTIAGVYNIRLHCTDSVDLKEQLSSIYGLNLIDTIAEVKHLIIDFEDNNY